MNKAALQAISPSLFRANPANWIFSQRHLEQLSKKKQNEQLLSVSVLHNRRKDNLKPENSHHKFSKSEDFIKKENANLIHPPKNKMKQDLIEEELMIMEDIDSIYENHDLFGQARHLIKKHKHQEEPSLLKVSF